MSNKNKKVINLRLIICGFRKKYVPLSAFYEKAQAQLSAAKTTLQKSKADYEFTQQQLEKATINYHEQQKNEPLIETYTKTISQLEQALLHPPEHPPQVEWQDPLQAPL